MILKELMNCYDLMCKSDKFMVDTENSSFKRVGFKFIINEDGLVKQVIDLRQNKKGIFISVPLQKTRTSGVYPFFMCDNSKYLLGITYNKEKKSYVDTLKEHTSSKEYHQHILKGINSSKYYRAIINFFENRDKNIEIVKQQDEECLKENVIVFSLEGDKEFIHDIKEVIDEFIHYRNVDKEKVHNDEERICLVSGEITNKICNKYEVVPIKGGQAAGSYLCFRGSDSYDRVVSISHDAMFKYTSALKMLLLNNTNNILLSGNTVVFWSDRIGSKEEAIFSAFFSGDNNNQKDDETEYNQKGVDEIDTIIKLMKKGKVVNVDNYQIDDNVNMYILGLSPVNARIFIRFWYKNSIKNFVELFNKHFEDTKLRKKVEVSKKNYVYEDLGVKLSLIIKTITPQGKAQNTPNTLINTLFKSILMGTMYPISILNNILLRIRAESKENFAINHTRVSYIKGYLKRFYRFNNLKEKEEEVTVALNENSNSVAYNLGRIFAIIEKIQLDANNSSNIREKYLSAASSTPRSIYPTLLNLSQHHISKINKGGNKTFNYYDKLVGQILLKIEEFPSILSVEEQGMFILGYYHQREDIYTSNKNKEES